jgi:cation transport ATPase
MAIAASDITFISEDLQGIATAIELCCTTMRLCNFQPKTYDSGG